MFEFEDIYNTMIGNCPEDFLIDWVERINIEGSPYDLAYKEVLEACDRLRIAADRNVEDEDVETILQCMFTMQKAVAWGMFMAGIKYRSNFNQ